MSVSTDPKTVALISEDGNGASHLQLNKDGSIEVEAIKASAAKSKSKKTCLATTVTECSWNLYATAKRTNRLQLSNQAGLIDTSSSGETIRVGNTIFVPRSDLTSTSYTKFIPEKFSLYIDTIQERDKLLVVTSRQNVSTAPSIEDENSADPTKDIDAKSKDQTATNAATSELVGKTADNVSGDVDDKAKADSSEDDSGGESSQVDSENDDDKLSAYESWSEASTRYDSDVLIKETRPQRPIPPKPAALSDSESSDADSGDSSSEDSDNENKVGNLIEDPNEPGRRFDWEDDQAFFDVYAGSQSDEPSGNESDDRQGYESDDYPAFSDGSDEWFQTISSDSCADCDDCSDDGGACPLPSAKGPSAASTEAVTAAEAEEPVGTPMSQVHIYDISEVDDENKPKRIFRFERPTNQILYDSPPVLHPRKPLLVWPLDHGRILFGDYEQNRYFVRKLWPSQFWSTQVSINCQFSKDGHYLHVVTVEKLGSPPVRLPRRRNKKSEPPKPKEETAKFELVVSSYRVSERKTTKSPPLLASRTQKSLGELSALPTITWNTDRVFVATALKTTCMIHQFDLISSHNGKSTSRNSGEIPVQRLTVTLPEWAVGRKVVYKPSEGSPNEFQLIVTAKGQTIPEYKNPKKDEIEKSETATEADKKEEAPTKGPVSSTTNLQNGDLKSTTGGEETHPTAATKVVNGVTAEQDGQVIALSEFSLNSSGSHHTETTSATNGASNEVAPTSEDKMESKETEKPTSDLSVPPCKYPKAMIVTISSYIVESLHGWQDVKSTDHHNDVKKGSDPGSNLHLAESMFRPIEDVFVEVGDDDATKS